MSSIKLYFSKLEELKELEKELKELEKELKDIKYQITVDAKWRLQKVKDSGLSYKDISKNNYYKFIISGLNNHNLACSINHCVKVYSDSRYKYADVEDYGYCDANYIYLKIGFDRIDIPVEFLEYDGDDIVDWVRHIYYLGRDELAQYEMSVKDRQEDYERKELARLKAKYENS